MNESERSQLYGYLKTLAEGVGLVLTGEMLNTVELQLCVYSIHRTVTAPKFQ